MINLKNMLLSKQITSVHTSMSHINKMSDRLSMRAWPSCLLSSAGDPVHVPAERLRNECVLRGTSLVLPLVV